MARATTRGLLAAVVLQLIASCTGQPAPTPVSMRSAAVVSPPLPPAVYNPRRGSTQVVLIYARAGPWY
jgi:hypothetical protein